MDKTRYLRDMMKFDDSVRAYTPSPFFWVGGLTMSLFPVLSVGGTQLCTDRFDAEEVLALFERERVTRANLYPHQLEAMLAHPGMETYDRSSLVDADARLLVGAARDQPHPPDELSIGVGMTETFGGYWWGRFDAPADGVVLRPGERRTPPLDVLHPGVELKVVDEAGAPVPDGGTGEICIRGVCVTPGLYKTPREEIFDADGWFHTGDLGEVDGKRVHFRGRMGEMIKTAGANVTPKEVVEALCAIDGVETAHVVALPDPVRGQVVAAAVVAEEGRTLDADAIRAELKNELSTFKVPAYIEFFHADEIPWTQSFKIRKGMLAEMIKERVASAER
jgi:acyl-CoA synthetase (AMP-forming)/AMP-acid ligase II